MPGSPPEGPVDELRQLLGAAGEGSGDDPGMIEEKKGDDESPFWSP
eukprot:gene32409-59307_t